MVNYIDVTDWFQEQVVPDPASPGGLSIVHQGQNEPILPIPEVYRKNNFDGVPDNLTVVPPGGGIPPVTLVVPRRNNGPVVQLDLANAMAISVQYSGFSATRELDTFEIWNGAKNLEDFVHGVQFFDVGSLNFAYSDAKGNIAFFSGGEVPVREDLQAGTITGLPPMFLRNGTGGNEWLPVQHPQPGQALGYEILPFNETPQIINPPAGWFVNANNDPVGNTLDNNALNQLRPGGGIYYLNADFAPTQQEIAHSVAATLYSVWRGQFIRNTLDAPLVPFGLPTVDDFHAGAALRHLLDVFPTQGGVGASGLNFFNVPGVASAADRRDILLLKSLAYALDRLAGPAFALAFANSANLDDYRWGKLHRLVLSHTLGGPFNIPPAGGAFPPPLPGLDGIPMDGGLGSVDAAIHGLRADGANGFMATQGPIFRLVTTAGPDIMRGVSSVPGGVSGILGSPRYADLLPGWLTNEAFPLWTRPSDVRLHASSVEKFVQVN